MLIFCNKENKITMEVPSLRILCTYDKQMISCASLLLQNVKKFSHTPDHQAESTEINSIHDLVVEVKEKNPSNYATGNGSYRKASCFTAVLYSSFFHREISEVRGPISAKFCHIFENMFNLQMLVQNFGGLPPKKFWGQKTC